MRTGGKKCLFFRKFGPICFLERSVLRFNIVPLKTLLETYVWHASISNRRTATFASLMTSLMPITETRKFYKLVFLNIYLANKTHGKQRSNKPKIYYMLRQQQSLDIVQRVSVKCDQCLRLNNNYSLKKGNNRSFPFFSLKVTRKTFFSFFSCF